MKKDPHELIARKRRQLDRTSSKWMHAAVMPNGHVWSEWFDSPEPKYVPVVMDWTADPDSSRRWDCRMFDRQETLELALEWLAEYKERMAKYITGGMEPVYRVHRTTVIAKSTTTSESVHYELDEGVKV